MNTGPATQREPPIPFECPEEDFDQVAAALGESPETVISIGLLRARRCQVYLVGEIDQPRAVALQDTAYPEEPVIFGLTAQAVASLVPLLEGWTCINISPRFASQLTALVELEAGAQRVRSLDDVYYRLDGPVNVPHGAPARMLTTDDAPLIEQSSPAVVGDAAGSLLSSVRNGHVAAVIVNDRIVALAHTFMISREFADIGVVTDEALRGRGYASAAAALVCQAVQAGGRTPVWSCGATNLASNRVALKLGFREVSRRIYLIPEFG